MIIERNRYLDMLIAGQGNGLVKIVTGGRRCGKSFLLFRIFHDYLLGHGVDSRHLIELSLDERRNRKYCNPDELLDFIDSRINDDGEKYFVILDEIQLVEDFIGVLLSLMHTPNVEIYVSGSNSKFLSKDVVTEFRGRGQEIRIWPLSFSEFYETVGGERSQAWKDYYTFGGLPQILSLDSERTKREYLKDIYEVTYLKDVIDRNHIRNTEGLRQLVQILASGIGSSTNAARISNTFRSVSRIKISDKTINDYIGYVQEAFLIEEALRYDVKGRKYIGTETKYYFCDLGLRNIILNFRQQEETHIMENIIYNELRMRGYLVDVGLVECWFTDENNNRKRSGLEVDFIVNNGAERLYIQSAFKMPDELKEKQERRPLLNIGDNFRKMIVVKDDIKKKTDDDGIVTIGLFDFLLDNQSVEKIM